MEKNIRIVLKHSAYVDIDSLYPLQGELVEISDENKASLKKEIVETGFGFAPHVWLNPEDNKIYILDGHQRIKVMKELREEGYSVGQIIATFVEAYTEKEAKRRILQSRSSYGSVTPQGLFDFMQENDFKFEDVKVSFNFPSIDMNKFENFFTPPSSSPVEVRGSTEISEEQFSHLTHTCPECGHKFGKGE